MSMTIENDKARGDDDGSDLDASGGTAEKAPGESEALPGVTAMDEATLRAVIELDDKHNKGDAEKQKERERRARMQETAASSPSTILERKLRISNMTEQIRRPRIQGNSNSTTYSNLDSSPPSSTGSILTDKERIAYRRSSTREMVAGGSGKAPFIPSIMDEKDFLVNRKSISASVSGGSAATSMSSRGISNVNEPMTSSTNLSATSDENSTRRVEIRNEMDEEIASAGIGNVVETERRSPNAANSTVGLQEDLSRPFEGVEDENEGGNLNRPSPPPDILYSQTSQGVSLMDVEGTATEGNRPQQFVVQVARLVNEDDEEARIRYAEERGRYSVLQEAVRATVVRILDEGDQVSDESNDERLEKEGNRKRKPIFWLRFLVLALTIIVLVGVIVGVLLRRRRGDNKTTSSVELLDNSTSFQRTVTPTPAPSGTLRPTIFPVSARPSSAPTMAPTMDNLQCENARLVFTNGKAWNETLPDRPVVPPGLNTYYVGCGHGLNNMAFGGPPTRWYRLTGNGMMVTATFCNSVISRVTTDQYFNQTYGLFILVYSANCTFTCQTLIKHRAVGNCIRYSWYAAGNMPYTILVRSNYDERIELSGPYSLSLHGNDQCEYASEIHPGSVQLGSTVTAASSLSSPVCNALSPLSPGLWYWTRGTGETFSFDTCSSTVIDTKIAVFTGTCNGMQLQCATVNDNAYRCDTQSSVSWKTAMNQTYFIYVYGGAGSFALTGSSSPANDICQGAAAINLTAVSQLSSSSSYQVNGTTAGATVRSDAKYFYDEQFTFPNWNTMDCNFYVDDSPGVWYRLRAVQDVLATVDMCKTVAVGTFKPRLALFEGSCQWLTCVNGTVDYSSCANSYNETSSHDRVTWTAKANTTYYLFVQASVASARGDFVLRFNASTAR